MSVYEGLVLVRVEPDRLLGLLLLTFPTHEIPLDVCDNSLAPSLTDLGNSLGVYVESTIAQPNRVGMGDHPASIHGHDRIAVLVDVTVNADQLANRKFGFEGLHHDEMDSSNSLLGCKDLSNFHPILSGRSLGRPFRPTVMDSGERLPVLRGYCIGSIAQKVCHDDALGIDFAGAILIRASDLGALRQGILPVNLPYLHAPNGPAIVPHRIILPLALHLGQRIQEGTQVGTGCIKLTQADCLGAEGGCEEEEGCERVLHELDSSILWTVFKGYSPEKIAE